MDLEAKSTAEALYEVMIEKKVNRVWVSRNTQAIIREDGNLYTKKKYNRELRRLLPYVCDPKPYEKIQKNRKKTSSKKLATTKRARARPY